MVTDSRTSKSIKNSLVALAFYFINLVLQFFSRKVFLDYLGAEILGLNTTATNLLQFLNLAELGIGSAIACTLYKPLLEKDTVAINEIVSLQGWLYRRIAWIVIVGSLVLMAFFPWIFAKMPLPLWYAYASFGVLPCALRGGVSAGEYLQKKLGIGYGETTPDGLYTLVEGECMGACGDAPVMLVNNHKMCSFMSEETIEKKLAELN